VKYPNPRYIPLKIFPLPFKSYLFLGIHRLLSRLLGLSFAPPVLFSSADDSSLKQPILLSSQVLIEVSKLSTLALDLATQPCNSHLTDENNVQDLTSLILGYNPCLLSVISQDLAITKHASAYLGSTAYLSNLIVYANHPKRDQIETGSKLWHRDSDVETCAEYYINLSDVTSNSGPLFVCKDVNSHRLYYPFPRPGSGWSDSDRYSDSEIASFFGAELFNVTTCNIGPIGRVTFLDSGLHFHKGGNAFSNLRIVLRLVFEGSKVVAQHKLFSNVSISPYYSAFYPEYPKKSRARSFSFYRKASSFLLKLRHYQRYYDVP